jgi:energy-coupling factor transport system substrate-specific component
VTWQVGAFGLLAIALATGFAWYERARPDARIVALVGTLAAFAALGRIAFAAVPNVKPTTDIVLVSGYALGAGPGFAVGAIAGLTSNFFFGQGPWTPWQMAAWGATGLIGAGLARLMAVRSGNPPPPLGRWPLAIICCAVGFGFTAMQDVGDWVTYSDHSAGALGLYVGQGLGFDAIHAAGCLAFALAFGPALTRSIQRFARRIQVTWASPGGAVVPVLLIAMAAVGVRAPAARAASVAPANPRSAAAAYLLGAENADGGFGSAPGQPSNQLYAGWAALGLASAGYDLNRVARGTGLMAYVAAGAGTTDPGSLERTILVVRAAGRSARGFAGHDLVAELDHDVRRDGSVADQVNWTAFAVLALRSTGAPPGARTLRWLLAQPDADGGFGFAGAGSSSDVDDTGAVLEALAGDRAAGRVISRAVAYLRRQQDRDGGFPSQSGMGSNAQSTAWAIQGLDAVGVSPAGFHRDGAVSPVAYLDALTATNGAVRYASGLTQSPVWVTGEALMAMEGKPLPLAAPAPMSPVAASTSSMASSTTTASAASAPSSHRSRASRSAHVRDRTRTARRPASNTGSVSAHPPSLREFAAAVGWVTAVVLAPIGLG